MIDIYESARLVAEIPRWAYITGAISLGVGVIGAGIYYFSKKITNDFADMFNKGDEFPERTESSELEKISEQPSENNNN